MSSGWLEKVQAVKDRWDAWGRVSVERNRQDNLNSVDLERKRLANIQYSKSLHKPDYTRYYIGAGVILAGGFMFLALRTK